MNSVVYNSSFKEVLFWGSCYHHFKEAVICENAWQGRVVHVIIALVELPPGISQVVSLFEKALAKFLTRGAVLAEGKSGSIEASEDKQRELVKQALLEFNEKRTLDGFEQFLEDKAIKQLLADNGNSVLAQSINSLKDARENPTRGGWNVPFECCVTQFFASCGVGETLGWPNAL